MMKQIKTLSAVGAIAVAASLLAACSTGGGGSATATDETSATIAVFQELNTIDPPMAIDSNSAVAVNNVYEGLYRLDEENRPAPAGAVELPEVSDDGLTYTIALNPDAHWSDGTPVTAEDYAFAWRRGVSLDNAGENQKYYGVLASADEIIAGDAPPEDLGVEAVDEHTLRVTLKAPVVYFPSMLASVPFFPVPEEYVNEQGEEFASDSDHALYNGPFELADFAGPGIGGDWAYVANDEYWDAAAVSLDRITVRVIKETTTAISLYRTGEVDEVGISGPQVQAQQSDPGFVAQVTATSAFLGYNQNDEALADQRVREAISLVIDREQLAASVLADGSTAATGLIPPGLASDTTGADFAEAAGDLLSTDVTRAQDLWDEAQADLGIDELTLDLQTFDSDRVAIVAEYLQGVIEENLDGITVTITTNPVANFLEKMNRDDFSIYLVTWGADYADPSSQLGLVQSEAGTNWGHYDNPEFDAALDAAQNEDATDADARFADLLEAQEILIADQGLTPVYFQSSTVLRNPALQGVLFHTSGPALEYKSASFAK